MLSPGGWLYLGVPNALRWQERHYKLFMPPALPGWVARLYVRLRGRDPRFLDTLWTVQIARGLLSLCWP